MVRAGLLLVVEDEPLVSMIAQESLEAEGYIVVVVPTVSRALGLLRHAGPSPFDGAVLDVTLRRGEQVFPVADRLKELGVPYLFASGAGAALPDGAAAPLLLKPFTVGELVQAVAALLENPPARTDQADP